MPLNPSPSEKEKQLEQEIQQQKTKLVHTLQGTIQDMDNLLQPDGIPRLFLGNLVQKYPLPTLALLFAGGLLSSQIFKIEEE
jgi:hypothetical protein